ncbi:uncharacterized protein K02A2.6-like [Anastrepha ludens]|uniref:uncharacterized protein K02A2.6-like n=1 Tax=Anastrepha ludens TaxID=28586 RepID=UPI0023AE7855|nr:uncharacterized protein K02A2.6-like [Anastrepha ludens]
MPFSQMSAFKKEAERLTNAGIWKPIRFSQWASPIVLVPKPDGSVRICGDFKQAVNAQIDIEQYPLPTRESLFHAIRCGQNFSKIDLKDAYLQMELDDDSKAIMVVNTPLGLYQYQRLPYGIASATAIFQRYLEQLIQGIEGCGNYLDGIIITAPTFDEHMQRVENILQVLQSNGIKCKQQKCFFLQEKIEYLGRQISAGGILPDEFGLVAVRDHKPLKNIKQVEAFMDICPINMLRRKNVPFTWGPKQQQAFTSLKHHILNATQLAHYDEQLPLVLATDASSYGIGAVLSHTYPDGSERPMAFASKTLDRHQVRYSQIEKEGLSIMFGVKRIHQYLYGRPFTLITDHKPLVSIFNPSSQLPTMTSHRLQRWAITLMTYKYDVKYRKTAENEYADALSRLPLGPDEEFVKQEACLNVRTINTPIDPDDILKHAGKDAILRRVTAFVKNGWPEKLPPQDSDLRSSFNRKNSLTIINNLPCLQAEHTRVVIPASWKQQILQLLHDGHWGTSRIKQLARQHVWWVDIDNDIAKLAAKCDICKAVSPGPAREYEGWPEPNHPWERVHVDFAGPFFYSMWLICVDAFSQFPFIAQLTTTTTADTISALAAIFATEGIPKTLKFRIPCIMRMPQQTHQLRAQPYLQMLKQQQLHQQNFY